ncbi:MAG: hypothetical protein CMD92_07025, partial [Gammaproteobacteria bacterium]|nr:hypothetical protein [Gammaproteobacteria bacterium]
AAPPPAAPPPAAPPPAAPPPPAAAPSTGAFKWKILVPRPQGAKAGENYTLTVMNAAGQQSQVQFAIPRDQGGVQAYKIELNITIPGDISFSSNGLYVARIFPSNQVPPPPLGRVEIELSRMDNSTYRYNAGQGVASITDATVIADILKPASAKRAERLRKQDPSTAELVPVRRHTRLWKGKVYDPNLPGNAYNREWLQSPAWERLTYAYARSDRTKSTISDWYNRYIEHVYRDAYLCKYPPSATPGTFVTVKIDFSPDKYPFTVTIQMPPGTKAGDLFFLIPTTIEVPDKALGAYWFLANDLHGVAQPVLMPQYARPGDFVHSYVPRTIEEAQKLLSGAYGKGHAVKFIMATDPKRVEFTRAHAARAAARQAADAARAAAQAPAPAPALDHGRLGSGADIVHAVHAIDGGDSDEDGSEPPGSGGATQSLPAPPSVTVDALNNFIASGQGGGALARAPTASSEEEEARAKARKKQIERGDMSNAMISSDDESDGSNKTQAYGASSEDEEALA